MSDLDHLTRNISVPAWMVWLFSGLGIVASGTIGGAIVVDRNQVHELSNRMATVEARTTAMEVKQVDFTAMFNSINGTLRSVERKQDVIDAKLERLMP